MRVALPWLGYACGDCRYCNTGRETLCESPASTWATRSTAASPSTRSATPATSCACRTAIDPLDAAPLTCAGVTTYKAVKVSGARSSSLVAVFGAGGLGHLAIQYARITGAAVVAVDINAGAAARPARELGAEHVVHAGEEDPVAAIQRLGGADAAIATAVNPMRVRAGARLARPRRHARLRRPAGRQRDARSRSSRPSSAASRSRGSIVGTHHDLEEVFELHRRGLTTRRCAPSAPLDDVNEAIEQVLDGSAPAPRMVFDMQATQTKGSHGDRATAGV